MNSILQRLKDATKGLFYMSEGDYPFEVVSSDGTTATLVNKLLELSGKEKNAKVDVVTLERFFQNMTRVPFNPTAGQKQTAQHFLTLQQVLVEELSDISVYLIGEVEMDAFVIGTSANGTYAGLRTKVIRT